MEHISLCVYGVPRLTAPMKTSQTNAHAVRDREPWSAHTSADITRIPEALCARTTYIVYSYLYAHGKWLNYQFHLCLWLNSIVLKQITRSSKAKEHTNKYALPTGDYRPIADCSDSKNFAFLLPPLRWMGHAEPRSLLAAPPTFLCVYPRPIPRCLFIIIVRRSTQCSAHIKCTSKYF